MMLSDSCSVCISQLSTTVTTYLRLVALKEERFILICSFRSFCLQLAQLLIKATPPITYRPPMRPHPLKVLSPHSALSSTPAGDQAFNTGPRKSLTQTMKQCAEVPVLCWKLSCSKMQLLFLPLHGWTKEPKFPHPLNQ